MRRWLRLYLPKGQVLHRLLCQQVSKDPDVFRDAFGARQGPCNLCPAQNTFMLGKSRRLWGRAELAGGALSLSQNVSVISTNLAASSTAPLHPAAYLHAGPQQDEPHFHVFLELSSIMKPIWILDEAMDFLEIWSKETAQLCLNDRFS